MAEVDSGVPAEGTSIEEMRSALNRAIEQRRRADAWRIAHVLRAQLLETDPSDERVKRMLAGVEVLIAKMQKEAQPHFFEALVLRVRSWDRNRVIAVCAVLLTLAGGWAWYVLHADEGFHGRAFECLTHFDALQHDLDNGLTVKDYRARMVEVRNVLTPFVAQYGGRAEVAAAYQAILAAWMRYDAAERLMKHAPDDMAAKVVVGDGKVDLSRLFADTPLLTAFAMRALDNLVTTQRDMFSVHTRLPGHYSDGKQEWWFGVPKTSGDLAVMAIAPSGGSVQSVMVYRITGLKGDDARLEMRMPRQTEVVSIFLPPSGTPMLLKYPSRNVTLNLQYVDNKLP